MTKQSKSQAEKFLESLPPGPITLESLQAIHEREREVACQQLDELAEELKRQDEERRKKWGNKFPVHYLDQPKEATKIHPVEVKKAKGRKKT